MLFSYRKIYISKLLSTLNPFPQVRAVLTECIIYVGSIASLVKISAILDLEALMHGDNIQSDCPALSIEHKQAHQINLMTANLPFTIWLNQVAFSNGLKTF